MTKFFGDNKSLNKKLNAALEGDLADEKLYSALIENGDTRTLNAVRTVLQDTDQLKQLQGFMLNQQLVPASLADDSLFSAARTRNNLLNQNKNLKIANFVDPEDYEEFANLVTLADEFGGTISNPSKSGIVNMLAGGVKNIAKVSGLLEGTLEMQKGRAIRAAEAATRPRAPLFGPRAIGPREAIGLRLPQAISRQDQEE